MKKYHPAGETSSMDVGVIRECHPWMKPHYICASRMPAFCYILRVSVFLDKRTPVCPKSASWRFNQSLKYFLSPKYFFFRIISKKGDFENRFSLYSKISFIRGPPAFSKVAIPLCRTLSLSQFSIKAMSLSLQSLSSIEIHSINMKVNNSKSRSGHHQILYF